MPGLGTKSGTAFRRDILANRPVAEPSIEGFMFFATDDNQGTLYQCNGITWLPVTNGLRSVVAGTGISIVNSPSTITVNTVLPVATSSTLGAVKIGSNIFIDAGGHISVPVASDSILGVIRVGSGLEIDGDGILSVIDLPVEHNGTLVADRHILNLIDGTNITMSIVDDAPNNRVSVTVNASGGGSTLNRYEKVVMSHTPLAFWPLTELGTEPADTYADISGNSHDLHPRFSTADFIAADDGYMRNIPGMFQGQSAPFFGTKFYDTAGALYTTSTAWLPYGSTPYTMEVWVKGAGEGFDSEDMTLMQYGKIRGTGGFAPRNLEIIPGFGWFFDNTPSLAFISNAGSTEIDSTIYNQQPFDGNWNYIGLSYDPVAGILKRYYNGRLVLTDTGLTGAQLSHTVDDVFFLGDSGYDPDFNRTTPTGQFYAGGMSHAAIYDRVLTDDEVLSHWQAALDTGIRDRVVMCNLYREGSNSSGTNAEYTSLPDNSTTLVKFNLSQTDMGTSVPHHDYLTPESLIIQESGYYEVTGRLVIQKNRGSITSTLNSQGKQYRVRVTSPVTVTSGVDTALTFGAYDWSTGVYIGGGINSTHLPIFADGTYHFDINVQISASADSAGAVKDYIVMLKKNGTTVVETVHASPPAYNTQDITLTLSTDYIATAGAFTSDYFQVIVNQNSGVNQTVRVASDAVVSRYDAGGSYLVVQIGYDPISMPLFFPDNKLIDSFQDEHWTDFDVKIVHLSGHAYLTKGNVVGMLVHQQTGQEQRLDSSFFFDEQATKLSVRKLTNIDTPYADTFMSP